MNSPPQEESDPFDDSSNNSEDSPNISLLSAAEETEVGAITSDASLFAKIDTIDQTMRKLVFIVKQIREMGKSVNNRMLLIDLDTTGQKRLKCLSDIPDMNAKIQNAFNLELNSSGEGVIRWYKVKDYLLKIMQDETFPDKEQTFSAFYNALYFVSLKNNPSGQAERRKQVHKDFEAYFKDADRKVLFPLYITHGIHEVLRETLKESISSILKINDLSKVPGLNKFLKDYVVECGETDTMMSFLEFLSSRILHHLITDFGINSYPIGHQQRDEFCDRKKMKQLVIGFVNNFHDSNQRVERKKRKQLEANAKTHAVDGLDADHTKNTSVDQSSLKPSHPKLTEARNSASAAYDLYNVAGEDELLASSSTASVGAKKQGASSSVAPLPLFHPQSASVPVDEEAWVPSVNDDGSGKSTKGTIPSSSIEITGKRGSGQSSNKSQTVRSNPNGSTSSSSSVKRSYPETDANANKKVSSNSRAAKKK